MKFCVISSGSKGNMTYIEAGNTRLLIDAGISLPNAQKRVPEIDFSKITDILVTHEHGDHTHFLDTVVKRTKANLYIAKESFKNLDPLIKDNLIGRTIGFLESDSCYKIGDVEVCTLTLLHDCKNNFGYIVMYNNKKIGYFTDTGIFPSRYKNLLPGLDALIIEANHNIEMLMNSKRDFSLINRILASTGHISNQACYELLRDVLNDRIKYVVLAHISEDCNSLEALNTDIILKLTDYKGKIIVSSQREATELIEI